MDKKETLQANVAIDTENSIQQVWDSVFTVSPEVIEKFGRDVERLSTTLISYPKPIHFPLPPVYLALDGIRPDLAVKDNVLSLSKDKLRKIIGLQKDKQDEAHTLTLAEAKQLPERLANPLLIIQDKAQGLVAIIDIQNKDGRHYSVAIHLDKLLGRKQSNEIASVYARSNLKNWLGYERNDGSRGEPKDIVYFRQEKSRESTRQSQTNETLKSLLGVGALQRLVANRSESSFSTENKILNSEDVVNFYLKKIAQKEEPIINLTGLCPREAGRKLFEATQGNLAQWALIERSAAAVGMTVDKKALEAAQGKAPLVMQEVMMKAVTLNVKEVANNRNKTIDKERQR